MARGIVLVQLRMPQGLYGKLRDEAEEAGISLNRYVAECVREGRKHVEVPDDDEDDKPQEDNE